MTVAAGLEGSQLSIPLQKSPSSQSESTSQGATLMSVSDIVIPSSPHPAKTTATSTHRHRPITNLIRGSYQKGADVARSY